MVRLESYALNVALLAACAISVAATPPAEPPATPAVSSPIIVDSSFSATFVPGIPAVTYDPAAVPETATVRFIVVPDGQASLTVAGFGPDQIFPARLHTNECGPSGVDAGPRYQHTIDPDPADANPENEVWLNFTTDGTGVANVEALHPWPFNPNRPPRSLLVGDPSAYLACVTIPWS